MSKRNGDGQLQMENDAEMDSSANDDRAGKRRHLGQPPNAPDWTFEQSNGDGEEGGSNNQIGMMKMKIEMLEYKCALYEKRENMAKLEAQIEKEKDKKQIEELKETQGKMQKMIDAAYEQIEQLKRENQRKLGEADKRAEQMQIAHNVWKFCNPAMNKWNGTGTEATISADGLSATIKRYWTNVFAILPFSFATVSQDENDGTIQLKYFEVKTEGSDVGIGLSPVSQYGQWVGSYANSFALCPHRGISAYRFAGREKQFEWPEGAVQPKIKEKQKGRTNIFGCGMMAWPDGKRAIFFTANGTLLGNHIPISTDVSLFYPAVSLCCGTIAANFGDNPSDSFAYDVTNCPGMNLNKE